MWPKGASFYNGAMHASPFAALIVFLSPLLATADVSAPYARVQPDASLRIDSRIFRLYGIYVPPTEETCRSFERPIMCGPRAVLALDFKVQSGFVRCEEKGADRAGAETATCFVDGEDLAAYMLRQGWAVALPDAPIEYKTLERIARARGLGIWGIPLD